MELSSKPGYTRLQESDESAPESALDRPAPRQALASPEAGGASSSTREEEEGPDLNDRGEGTASTMQQMQQMQVTVPAGVAPGMTFQVSTPSGLMMVTCPAGVGAGSVIIVNVPVSVPAEVGEEDEDALDEDQRHAEEEADAEGDADLEPTDDPPSEAEDGGVEEVLQLLEALADEPQELMAVLRNINPAPGSCAEMVLDLLSSGLEPRELLPQLREAFRAGSPEAVSDSVSATSIEADPARIATTRSGYARVPLETESDDTQSGRSRPAVRWTGGGWADAPGRHAAAAARRERILLVLKWAVALLAVLALAVGFIWLSIDFLEPLTLGLDYSYLWNSVGPAVFAEAGVHWLGPFHRFIRVPSDVQTFAFGYGYPEGHIHARSADGLNLMLTVAVQWRYRPEGLRELFLQLPPEEWNATAGSLARPAWRVLHNTVVTSVLGVASEYSMHRFFDEKQAVSRRMQDMIAAAFARVGADATSGELPAAGVLVDATQLLLVELPGPVEEALLTTTLTRLKIEKAGRYKNLMKVGFQINQMAAEYQLLATLETAKGHAKARTQRAEGAAAMTAQTVLAEMSAFANVTSSVKVDPQRFLSYRYFDLISRGAPTAQGPRTFMLGSQDVYSSAPAPPASFWGP